MDAQEAVGGISRQIEIWHIPVCSIGYLISALK